MWLLFIIDRMYITKGDDINLSKIQRGIFYIKLTIIASKIMR